ncbi:Putative endonuclease, Z1 domain-containing protein [[Mycoplasma] cavipharyngis]|uniref:Z1 domain-containing protein n=1 Tax=[Mycoplasma] cavipharyngis TaxID=92757 RepID=UPI00370371C3
MNIKKKNVSKIFANNLEKQDLTQNVIDKIFNNNINILRNFINSKNQIINQKKVGIVIDKIQSGKTTNFHCLLSLALDNGYDIGIVFGGSENDLLEQNLNRMKQSFISDQNEQIVEIFNSKDSINFQAVNILQFLKNQKKVIIICLKNITHLNRLNNVFNHIELKRKKTLIIDDEGDQATLNTQIYTKKTASKIYSEIKKLFELLIVADFLSVTATPNANILVNTKEWLSPNFVELIDPSDDYCGLDQFHSLKNKNIYVKTVKYDGSGKIKFSLPTVLPKVFANFFIAKALRLKINDHGKHAMLLHVTKSLEGHNQLKEFGEIELSKWTENFYDRSSFLESDLATISLIKLLKTEYDDFKKNNSFLDFGSFENLWPYIVKAIKDCYPTIYVYNSENNKEKDIKSNTYIVLGGDKLSRGLTIQGLTTSLFLRRSKNKANIDTLLQRARWLGYRKKYLNFCRVFTTEDIKKDFESISVWEEKLWSDLKDWKENNDHDFREFYRVLEIDSPKLRATRPNVAKQVSISTNNLYKSNYIILDQTINDLNWQIVENFKMKNINQYQKTVFNHRIIKDLSFLEIIKKILKNLTFNPNEIKFNQSLINKLERMFETSDHLADIVFVRVDNKLDYDRRKINLETGKIETNLFTGRSSSSNGKYLGDAKIAEMLNRKDMIQLWVYLISPTDSTNIISPTFVLYIPEHISKKTSNLFGSDFQNY